MYEKMCMKLLELMLISGVFLVDQRSQKWLSEDRKLLKMTDEVDYDTEGMYVLRQESFSNCIDWSLHIESV